MLRAIRVDYASVTFDAGVDLWAIATAWDRVLPSEAFKLASARLPELFADDASSAASQVWSGAFRDLVLSPSVGRGFYRKKFTLPWGAVLNTDAVSDGHGRLTHQLVLSGVQCALLDFEQVYSLVTECFALGGRFTRLDIAVDGYTPKALQPQALYAEALDGCLRGRFVSRDVVEHGKVRRQKPYELVRGGTGDTLYVGSRTSDRFLRVYDAYAAGHYDDEGVFRYELELKGYFAKSFSHLIFTLNNCSDYYNACIGAINGFCQLIYRDDSNISRCSLRPEWSDYWVVTDKLSLIPKTVVKPQTISRGLNWLKTAAKWLAVASCIPGAIDSLVELGMYKSFEKPTEQALAMAFIDEVRLSGGASWCPPSSNTGGLVTAARRRLHERAADLDLTRRVKLAVSGAADFSAHAKAFFEDQSDPSGVRVGLRSLLKTWGIRSWTLSSRKSLLSRWGKSSSPDVLLAPGTGGLFDDPSCSSVSLKAASHLSYLKSVYDAGLHLTSSD